VTVTVLSNRTGDAEGSREDIAVAKHSVDDTAQKLLGVGPWSFRKAWFSNKIVSSEGYFVRTVGRSEILYGERRRFVSVSAERLVDGWALYSDDMRMGSESGPPLDDPDLRALIAERIKAVFEWLGIRLEVD
jgi:hypothetical protein